MTTKKCKPGSALLLCLLYFFSSIHGQDCTGIVEDVESTIIPNHSFELYSSCPSTVSEMDLALSWIQASEPTSDLLHFCGSNPNFWQLPSVPLPIPDGQGFVGMLNLYDYDSGDGWLEYVGTCPTQSMEAFTPYTLRFQMGFGNGGEFTSPSNIGITLYGHQNCSALPFSGQRCPMESNEGWIELAQATISGNDEWVEVTFQFTPTTNISAIVLGPSCEYAADQGYFFLDELLLMETQVNPVNPTIDISGTPCQDIMSLSAIPATSAYNYQWFHNGNSIPGANTPFYNVPVGTDGFYHVRLTDPNGNGCEESELFDIVLPLLSEQIDTVLCHGTTLLVDGQTIDSSGAYTFDITTPLGCDSSLFINVTVLDPIITELSPIICAGDTLDMSGQQMTTTGDYVLNLSSELGCDSTVYVNLTVQEAIEVNSSNSEILCAGDTSMVTVEIVSGDALQITWEDGNTDFNRLLTAGDFFVTLTDAEGCSSTDNIVITEPPILESNIVYTDISCIGFNDGEIQVHPTGGVAPYRIYFDDYPVTIGDSISYELLAPGDYLVSVLDKNDCIVQDTILLIEPEDPEINIEWEELEMTLGNDQLLKVRSNNQIFFEAHQWMPANQMDCDSCHQTIYTPASIGTEEITIQLMDANNCIYVDTITINIADGVAIPNAFSPNGDGHNDQFFVMGQGIAVIARLSIFSRNGAELFRMLECPANDPEQGWDGQFRGEAVDAGVYVYLVDLVLLDGTEIQLSGDLTLLK